MFRRPYRLIAALVLLAGVAVFSCTRQDGPGVQRRAVGGTQTGLPQRVLPASVAAAEWLLELVEPGRIVALPTQIDDFSIVDAGVAPWASIPRIPSFKSELVRSFDPDLVLVSPFTDPATVARVRRRGPVVLTMHEPSTWEELMRGGRELAKAVGAEARGAAFLDQLVARRKALATRGSARALRVLPYGRYTQVGSTYGKGTTVDLALSLAGYVNVAAEAGVVRFADLSNEDVMGLDFDAFLVGGDPSAGGAGLASLAADALRADPMLSGVPAIASDRILIVRSELLVAGSHLVLDASESIAREGDL